jgi:anti-anti-sigma factor
MSTAPQLEGPLGETLESSQAGVMIDLSGCEFIDSTGIAVIVKAWQQLDRAGGGDGEGRLVLCCVTDQVRRLLEITGVENSISIYEDRDAALAELRS